MMKCRWIPATVEQFFARDAGELIMSPADMEILGPELAKSLSLPLDAIMEAYEQGRIMFAEFEDSGEIGAILVSLDGQETYYMLRSCVSRAKRGGSYALGGGLGGGVGYLVGGPLGAGIGVAVGILSVAMTFGKDG